MTTGKNTNTAGVVHTYCLDRAKGRIASALWGLLFLFLGFCMGVYGFTLLGEDKAGWDYMEYIKLAIGWLACAGFLALGVWTCFTALRDSLQPGKSALARSIRAQLPRPEEAPGWQELFAMVDNDLAAGANWFEKIGIGSQWVLGDEASYIPNIRGVYRRHEIHHRANGGGTRQITQLFIVDDRQQSQVTDLLSCQELDAAIQCLRLRAPAAAFGNYNDYLSAIGCSQEEWDRREHDFRLRQAKLAERSAPTPAAGEVAGFVLTRIDDQRTSRVTKELLAEQMEALAPGQRFVLSPTPPVPAGMKQIAPGVVEELIALNCVCHGNGTIYLAAILKTSGSEAPPRGFGMLGVERSQALEVLTGLLRTHQAPDVFGEGWQAIQVQVAQGQEQEKSAPYLNITDGAGVSRRYERFSRRDVELAAQGVADGKYQEAILWLPPRLIMLDAGGKEDGRATLQFSLPQNGAFRTYREKTTGRRAAEWFVGCLDGRLPEGFDRWKEVTKEWEKRVEKLEKQERKNANKK